jgi:predicted phosphodiesterase
VASGRVPDEVFTQSEALLKGLASDARVVVANHYPVLFPADHHVHASHELENLEETRAWVRSHPVDLYLHGHLHWNWTLEDESADRKTLHVNSASSTAVPTPRRPTSYHLIELDDGAVAQAVTLGT